VLADLSAGDVVTVSGPFGNDYYGDGTLPSSWPAALASAPPSASPSARSRTGTAPPSSTGTTFPSTRTVSPVSARTAPPSRCWPRARDLAPVVADVLEDYGADSQYSSSTASPTSSTTRRPPSTPPVGIRKAPRWRTSVGVVFLWSQFRTHSLIVFAANTANNPKALGALRHRKTRFARLSSSRSLRLTRIPGLAVVRKSKIFGMTRRLRRLNHPFASLTRTPGTATAALPSPGHSASALTLALAPAVRFSGAIREETDGRKERDRNGEQRYLHRARDAATDGGAAVAAADEVEPLQRPSKSPSSSPCRGI